MSCFLLNFRNGLPWVMAPFLSHVVRPCRSVGARPVKKEAKSPKPRVVVTEATPQAESVKVG